MVQGQTISDYAVVEPPICVHHWQISAPRLLFNREKAMGDMLEITDQACKKCGTTRVNVCLIPPERSVAD